MTQNTAVTDPFAQGDSNPSLSFKDKPIGTSYTGTVMSAPGWIQQRDFDTNEPKFFPDGNPAMMATVEVKVPALVGANGADDDGTRTVFAPKPSSLFSAIAKAQRDAGAGAMAPGGLLTVTLIGEEPNRDPKKNPKKLYSATYQPGGGVFAESAAPAQAAQQPAAAPASVAQPTAPVQAVQQAAAAPAVAASGALPPEVLAALIAQHQAAQQPAAPAVPAVDPARAAQVTQLRGVGLPDDQIAAALGLTPEQVATVQG